MKDDKVISRITRVGYLLIFATGFFANFCILESLVVDNEEPKAVVASVNDPGRRSISPAKLNS